MFEIIDKAKSLWPKATDAEIGLLKRIFDGADETKAIKILEEARIDSKYATIPFRHIKEKATHAASSGKAGGYIECWAVHQETKKFKNCCVLAQTNEGAQTMMVSYLRHRCHVEPTEYVLFIGAESHQAFWDYRMGNTKTESEYAF